MDSGVEVKTSLIITKAFQRVQASPHSTLSHSRCPRGVGRRETEAHGVKGGRNAVVAVYCFEKRTCAPQLLVAFGRTTVAHFDRLRQVPGQDGG